MIAFVVHTQCPVSGEQIAQLWLYLEGREPY